MNGIFPADLAVYLILFPIVSYIFITHRWTGFLPWYYLSVFCVARIIGGALGVNDSNSLAANIIQSVGISPLLLSVDGLIHEARVYRYPSKNGLLGWSVIVGSTATMATGVSLSVVGALNIYEGHVKPDSYALWKAGSALIVVLWVFQIFWSLFSLRSSKLATHDQAYQGSTALLQGAFIALLFIGIRVIYTLVAVCTQKRDLSPIDGSIAVRVVLMFLPEVLATLTLILVGLRTRHLRELKL
ncbi:integral membrane protein [Penicillium verhagenii]|nr:integral membrane protein [Penicillium verhagenii]